MHPLTYPVSHLQAYSIQHVNGNKDRSTCTYTSEHNRSQKGNIGFIEKQAERAVGADNQGRTIGRVERLRKGEQGRNRRHIYYNEDGTEIY